jgi:hypothetical protein
MGIHDQTASVVALARVALNDIDFRQETTVINSARLKLILETFIEVGSPNQNLRVTEANNEVRTLMSTFQAMQERNGN